MPNNLNHIMEEEMELSPSERVKLVTSIMTSLDEPYTEIDALWQKEAEDRITAYEKGEIKAKSLQKRVVAIKV